LPITNIDILSIEKLILGYIQQQKHFAIIFKKKLRADNINKLCKTSFVKNTQKLILNMIFETI